MYKHQDIFNLAYFNKSSQTLSIAKVIGHFKSTAEREHGEFEATTVCPRHVNLILIVL